MKWEKICNATKQKKGSQIFDQNSISGPDSTKNWHQKHQNFWYEISNRSQNKIHTISVWIVPIHAPVAKF